MIVYSWQPRALKVAWCKHMFVPLWFISAGRAKNVCRYSQKFSLQSGYISSLECEPSQKGGLLVCLQLHSATFWEASTRNVLGR